MADLRTKYMGLELKNPIIVGACNLMFDLDAAKRLEDYGASALVFKSLFEEQINLESIQLEEELREYEERNAEMGSIFPKIKHAGPEGHLNKFRQLKEAVGIPVIASLNCINPETWVEYALELEKAGADGLELNFFATPKSFDASSVSIEQEQIEILKSVISKVKIPVSVKLSPFYSNILHLIKDFDSAGVKGLVLFNHLFQPEIDVEKQEHYFPFYLSKEGDYRLPLRYAGLLYNNVNASICSNSGIFEGADVLKLLLAGADAVQVVSTVYKNKASHIGTMLTDINQWMEERNYSSLNDFKGLLSKEKAKDPYAYLRAQYVDLLMKPFDIVKRYTQV